jgi:adenylate cyclase
MASTNAADLIGRAPGGRKLIAVVYIDMVGYSRLIGLDDIGTLERLRAVRGTLIDPAINEHGGQIVQTGGDSLLIVFDSIDGAVRCAVKIQQQMPAYDADHPPDRAICFRVGINIGDVVADGTDYHGDGVNVAARLQAECPVGGICVSRAVRDHVHDRLQLTFEELGPLTLKNIARPVEAFVLRLETGKPGQDVSGPQISTGRTLVRARSILPRPRRIAFGALTLLAFAILSSIAWSFLRAPQATHVLPLASGPSISVLPFVNLSDDPAQEFFSDGIANDLTTALFRFRSLSVIASNSSSIYKRQPIEVKQVARELGVHFVLQGSVRKNSDQLRISVQLIDTISGNNIWAERYDRNVSDLFAIQDDITEAVTRAILPALEQAERKSALRKPPRDLTAWEAYQRGLWHVSRLSGADNELARSFFRQAIDRDPTLGRAYSELATTFNRDVVALRKTPREAVIVAEPLARKAVDLDELDAYAHVALGRILLYERGDYGDAFAEARRALELNPNLGLAHSTMGMVMTFSGQPQEGLAHARRGFELDPRNPSILPAFHVMIACYFLRDYVGAVEAARTSLRLYGAFGHTYYWLAAALAQLGQGEEAQVALHKAMDLKTVPYGISATGLRLPWMRLEDYEHELEGLHKAGWHG